MVDKISSQLHLARPMFALLGMSLCGLVSANGPAAAQAPASTEANEQVMIISPYVVRREPAAVNRATGPKNPELVSVSRPVSYADLDLSKGSGVAELQTRIRNTAREVCQELNRLYPRTGGQYVYTSTDCLKKAMDDGMEAVKQVTAATGK